MNKLILILLALVAIPLVSAGTESFDYQVNVSIVGCSIINGSLVDGNITVESGGTSRFFNSSSTGNNTFLGTLIANVSELSCPRLTCNLNNTGPVINVTCPNFNITLPPLVCPESTTQVCPTGTACQPINAVSQGVDEPKDNTMLYVIVAVLGVVGYMYYKKKKDAEKEEKVQPKIEPREEPREEYKSPGG